MKRSTWREGWQTFDLAWLEEPLNPPDDYASAGLASPRTGHTNCRG